MTYVRGKEPNYRDYFMKIYLKINMEIKLF